MKPILFYVDDEPNNLIVFEAAMPSDWEIHTFDNPLNALDAISKIEPWIVLSDQRMPGMMGVNFLELIQKVSPYSIRVLVTGFSEEDLVVDAVRKAKVYDYIRKPWDVDDLVLRITKMTETFILDRELRKKNELLEKQNNELHKLNLALKTMTDNELKVRKELEAWAPPFLLNLIANPQVTFPLRRDLSVLTFDLINSSNLHEVICGGTSIRKIALNLFSEVLIKYGGWRESHSGDSGYGHFGLVKELKNTAVAALSAATEFRVLLRNLSNKYSIEIECGIGLHHAKNCLIDVHTIEIKTESGLIIQKSFDSSSPEIDLVHRMEKSVHSLPGSNLVFSEEFVKELGYEPPASINLGRCKFKGQHNTVGLYLKPSDKVSRLDIDSFIAKLNFESNQKVA